MFKKGGVYMKKTLVFLGIFLLGVQTFAASNDVNYTDYGRRQDFRNAIIYAIRYGNNEWDNSDILTELLDDGRSNANVQSYVAEIIKNIKDTDDFKAAMKYYIENNCTVEGNTIKCSAGSSSGSTNTNDAIEAIEKELD